MKNRPITLVPSDASVMVFDAEGEVIDVDENVTGAVAGAGAAAGAAGAAWSGEAAASAATVLSDAPSCAKAGIAVDASIMPTQKARLCCRIGSEPQLYGDCSPALLF